MQDKNIDELFRSKLDAFEIEPSADVWPRIAVDIDLNKRKKAWAPYIGVAASIIVLFTAGILFIPKKEKQDAGQPVINRVVKTTVSRSVTKSEPILSGRTAFAVLQTTTHEKRRHPVGAEISPRAEAPDTVKTSGHAIAALATAREHQLTDPVVPGTATQLAVKEVVAVEPGFITHPTITPVRLTVISNTEEPVKASHKIHSLGGLINAVVARVDKRQDKVIEFTDDDDETNVTGINLGIIKIKKEK